jgi:hypothetical protein
MGLGIAALAILGMPFMPFYFLPQRRIFGHPVLQVPIFIHFHKFYLR